MTAPLKSFTDVFIRRPVLAAVLSLLIALVGVRAVTELPVQQYPRIERASILITTAYTGASAEVVRGFVTTPIERVVSAVGGIDFVESQSVTGSSLITVRLKIGHDSTTALAEVTARLQEVRSLLPADAQPPAVEVRRADRPYGTFYLGFTSTARSIPEITDLLARTVQPRLAILPGVQRVTFEGGEPLAMRVWIDPVRLAALNLSPRDIELALQRNNYLAQVGQARGNVVQVDLLADADLRTVQEFENLIVRDLDNAVVRLMDVARVELGAEEPTLFAKYNNQQGVYLGIWVQPGANDLEVGRHLDAAMKRIRTTLPADIDMRVDADASKYTRESLVEISKTLAETMAIVALVVLLFMGSIRTALVPLVAIPLSLLGAAVVMLAFGFSWNLMTLLAMALSVGLVVDDAIVVVENVQRHVREGKPRREAALLAARELRGPIIAMTITLATVYTPIAFQEGLTGFLFFEFAITLAVAVVISGIVALTLSPVMSARLISSHGEEGRFALLAFKVMDRLGRLYSRALNGALAMPWTIAVLSLCIVVSAWPLYVFSAKELAPVEDVGTIHFSFDAAPNASLIATNRDSVEVINALRAFPETLFVWSYTSAGGGAGGVELKDRDQRTRSTKEMYADVFNAAAKFPAVRVFPSLASPLPTPGAFDVELILQSDERPEQLLQTANQIIEIARASGAFLYVDTDLKIDLPQARVRIDRDRVANFGLDIATVSANLGTLFAGDYVNQFNYFDRGYRVIPQLRDADRESFSQLLDAKVATPSGALIPISAFAEIETTTAPRRLNRFQQSNAARVYGGLMPGVTKVQGLEILEKAIRSLQKDNLAFDYAGESREIRQEGAALTGTLAFAILLIYLVLAAQFQSFRDPLIVLLGSVPMALSAALAVTFLDITTVNIYSQVGLITLAGLIAKNGILIVEFANTLRARGVEKAEAIRSASLTRLRPVLMTSAATVLGHFPLVLASGAGAQARNSIGIVLVTGMTIGTVLTLFVVPVFYTLISAARPQVDAKSIDLEVQEVPA
jgi:multidrug efflux pump